MVKDRLLGFFVMNKNFYFAYSFNDCLVEELVIKNLSVFKICLVYLLFSVFRWFPLWRMCNLLYKFGIRYELSEGGFFYK